MDSVVITDQNFHEYFFDVKTHHAQPGQVMARFTSMVDLVDDNEIGFKRKLISMIKDEDNGARMASEYLQKRCGCSEREAVKLLLTMAKDLQTMSVEEVIAKPYRFMYEAFYYCKKEHIPNSPHWEPIKIFDTKLINFDEVMDKLEEAKKNEMAQDVPVD